MAKVHVLSEDDEVVAGRLRVSVAAFRASFDGRELPLTNKELRLLALLAANPGLVLRRERIAQLVWGRPVTGRTIDIHVSRLRKYLPPGAIETVIRVGYRLSTEALA
jgi:two-component system phosphate regulon response regulator PhoB/two-component system alkaline phosphatase synthesis response regulator PhoP